MVGKEPKLVPENFVGQVQITMTDIVRNMCLKTKHEIKHKSYDERGFI